MEELIIKFNNFVTDLLVAVILIFVVHLLFNFALRIYEDKNFPVSVYNEYDLLDSYRKNPNLFPSDKYELRGVSVYYKFYYLPNLYCLVNVENNEYNYPHQPLIIGNDGLLSGFICEGAFGSGTGVIGRGYSFAIIFNVIVFGGLFLVAKYHNWAYVKKICKSILFLYVSVLIAYLIFGITFSMQFI